MPQEIERALVVTAHPDDSEFGAAGTIAKLVRDGCEVTYVIVTNGNNGSSDRTMTPERLARIRADEQRSAARTLGVERVEFLGYDDGEVEDTRALRRDSGDASSASSGAASAARTNSGASTPPPVTRATTATTSAGLVQAASAPRPVMPAAPRASRNAGTAGGGGEPRR